MLQIAAIPAIALALSTTIALPAVLATENCPKNTILEVDVAGGVKCYDKAALEKLPQRTIRTENDFVDGKVAFRGPELLVVVQNAGGNDASEVEVIAADGYAIAIPVEELERYHPVLAMTADGQPIDHDMYGNLWLIYPMSDFPELQTEKWNGRLIWQVVRVTAE